MKIWLVRHGQTNLNKAKLMQGRSDEPLNETGIMQAHKTRELIGNVRFDAVYASPLERAINTGAIVGAVDIKDIIVDERIIETDFGKYEKCPYTGMGIAMSLYWTLPELFKAPDTVETIASMTSRVADFMHDLESKDYDNVLIAAHGGILRAVNGYLLNRKNKIQWRPKMHNCEVRIYELEAGVHKLVEIMKG